MPAAGYITRADHAVTVTAWEVDIFDIITPGALAAWLGVDVVGGAGVLTIDQPTGSQVVMCGDFIVRDVAGQHLTQPHVLGQREFHRLHIDKD